MLAFLYWGEYINLDNKLLNRLAKEGNIEGVNELIKNLYEDTENYDSLTNEQMVLIIQQYDDQVIWDMLYKKTERSIHKVMNNYVHKFYRDNEYDDTFTVLKMGWVKSVNKYNIYKATANFLPFSTVLMRQEYVNGITKKRKANKNGSSVISMPLSTVISHSGIDNSDVASEGAAACIAYDEDSEKEIEQIELQDMLQSKLKMLKTYYPISYDMIIESVYNNKTQTQIAIEYNMKQSRVSHHIKIGKGFLKTIISTDDYQCCENKNNI